jgi:Zn ribbon nucleic-acid-binding protein
MPSCSARPNCPKCGMNMIATSKTRDNMQIFECLRCGHSEKRKSEDNPKSPGKGAIKGAIRRARTFERTDFFGQTWTNQFG